MNKAIKIIKEVFSKQPKLGRNKAVIIKNLTNKYNGRVFLDNINFVVYRGEIFSVIGLSGGGKSTLLKSMVGLNPISDGSIYFFGQNPFFSKKLIGFSSQEDSFYTELTISENIKLFSEMNGVSKAKGLSTGIEYLKKLKLDNYLNSYPDELSGGQRKRLNIIISCLHSPKLLILDEPFAGLDYYNRRILWDFLTALKNKGVTVVLTTHLLEEAQKYSSRVLILKNGKKFAYGTFKDIKTRIGFNYLYHIKLSSLSQSFFESLNHYTMLKGIKIIYTIKNEVQFALDSQSDKSLINSFLSKNNQSFAEISLREPNLDEVMLASK
ncbi:MAG: ABC transporter ATP-binding protein [Nanoarchaeota archaeon]|nr:ABC transporter ATP-binding protein [Nanoarchaeota archaeon]